MGEFAIQDDSGDRTHPPTPLRLQEARRSGNVARSADVTTVVVIITALVLLLLLGPMLLERLRAMTCALLDGRAQPLADPATLASQAWAAGRGVLTPLLGLILGVTLAAAVAGLVQVGPLMTFEPIRPRLSRISPAGGLKRIFSGRSLVRVLLAAGKVALVAAVIAATLRTHWRGLFESAGNGTGAISVLGEMAVSLGIGLGIGLGVLAVVDWAYQRFQRLRDLRTSRRQWREDIKRSEGDPIIRRRRRSLAARIMGQRRSSKEGDAHE